MIGIVAAIGREISDFSRVGKFDVVTGPEGVKFLESAHLPNVVLAEGGPGRDRAQQATKLLVDEYDPRPDRVCRICRRGQARGQIWRPFHL